MAIKDNTDPGHLLQVIANKDVEIHILQSQVAERDQIIAGIKGSLAWKLSYPYRVVASAIKITAKGTIQLVKNPKAFSVITLRAVARFVRARPHLREKAHSFVSRLPENWQKKLVTLAPPSVEETGRGGVFVSYGKAELLGEANWIYARLTEPR